MPNHQKAVFQIRSAEKRVKKDCATGNEPKNGQKREHTINRAEVERPIHPNDMGFVDE